MTSARTVWENTQKFCAHLADLATKHQKLQWCQHKSAEIAHKLQYWRSEQQRDPYCLILAIQVGELETQAQVLEMVIKRIEKEESLIFPKPSGSSSGSESD